MPRADDQALNSEIEKDELDITFLNFDIFIFEKKIFLIMLKFA
jgi:hypothetical protein